jgi:hypothetical protein
MEIRTDLAFDKNELGFEKELKDFARVQLAKAFETAELKETINKAIVDHLKERLEEYIGYVLEELDIDKKITKAGKTKLKNVLKELMKE